MFFYFIQIQWNLSNVFLWTYHYHHQHCLLNLHNKVQHLGSLNFLILVSPHLPLMMFNFKNSQNVNTFKGLVCLWFLHATSLPWYTLYLELQYRCRREGDMLIFGGPYLGNEILGSRLKQMLQLLSVNIDRIQFIPYHPRSLQLG